MVSILGLRKENCPIWTTTGLQTLPVICGGIRSLCQNVNWLSFSWQAFLREGGGAMIYTVAQTYFALDQTELPDQTNLWPSL